MMSRIFMKTCLACLYGWVILRVPLKKDGGETMRTRGLPSACCPEDVASYARTPTRRLITCGRMITGCPACYQPRVNLARCLCCARQDGAGLRLRQARNFALPIDLVNPQPSAEGAAAVSGAGLQPPICTPNMRSSNTVCLAHYMDMRRGLPSRSCT